MRHRFLIGLIFLSPFAAAQGLDPVQWSLTSDAATAPPGATIPLRLTATLGPGWHLYSLTTPNGGPIPTRVTIGDKAAVQTFELYQPRPQRHFDSNFNLDTETFADQAIFLIAAKLKSDAAPGSTDLIASIRYQACSDRQCLPPRTKTASAAVSVARSSASPPAFNPPSGYTRVDSNPSPRPSTVATASSKQPGDLAFLLGAFGLGVAAIFTPCVFPMIPITVTFFLSRKSGILQAATFSLGIIVLFCALGLGITAAAGPFGVVQLGANPWVNGFIALVFGVFAVSLLGAFELSLSSTLLTKIDRASRRDGYAGTMLMGLTFSLTSFACVGPFMGSLLAASVQSKGAQPVLGMLSFAAGLASPFFFLAAFPAWLKRLPKSGNWLERVKVVMGFLLLAGMLKYLSNVDQVLQTGYLTRARFLAMWFVLLALAGFYLLGLVRLHSNADAETIGVGRLLVAAVFLSTAFSLLPGVFGSSLGELDAYVPESESRPATAVGPPGGSVPSLKNELDEALAQARREKKQVLVNFIGYACTNCHWMKANMFTRPEIMAALKQFVVVDLYTDGTDEASEKNQKFQAARFNTVALPFYAIVDPAGNTISTFSGLTRDPNEWLSFLQRGAHVVASGRTGVRLGVTGLALPANT